MGMTFWDTVRGHQLADTLIRELPKMNKRNGVKRQELVYMTDTDKDLYLQKALSEDGCRAVTSFVNAEGFSVVIIEK